MPYYGLESLPKLGVTWRGRSACIHSSIVICPLGENRRRAVVTRGVVQCGESSADNLERLPGLETPGPYGVRNRGGRPREVLLEDASVSVRIMPLPERPAVIVGVLGDRGPGSSTRKIDGGTSCRVPTGE
jgi:hypothetical protein